jgi:hypothetical protein
MSLLSLCAGPGVSPAELIEEILTHRNPPAAAVPGGFFASVYCEWRAEIQVNRHRDYRWDRALE